MRTGVDLSNYTGAPNGSWQALADRVDFVSPQAIAPPAGYPPGATGSQVKWSLDNGKLTVPYIWKWFGTGLADIHRRLDLLTPFSGQIDHLALDVEDTSIGAMVGGSRRLAPQPPPAALERFRRQPPPVRPQGLMASASSLKGRTDEIAAALELCDQFPTKSGLPTMVYSGGWYWHGYLANTTAFASRPNWASLYDGIADPRVWSPYGGWDHMDIKQYAGTSTLAGVGNLDLNVLADDYLLPLLLLGAGINVGSAPGLASWPDPARLLSLGFKWLRIVSMESAADYINSALAAGLGVLPIVTGESKGWVPGGVKSIQFGNESDVAGGVASWPPGPPQVYANQFNLYAGTYPQFEWISAGMASGIPGWAAQALPLLNHCAAVAVHPYAKTASEAQALLGQYAALHPRVVVTEWNRPQAEISGFAAMLAEETAASAWAHWSDEQTLSTEHIRMGLVDERGNPKPELDALVAANGGSATPPVPQPAPAPPVEVDQAWLDKKAQVIQWAGELGSLADQMDAKSDEMKALAAGVRDRAQRILQ
jgi:hypothetical protein